MSSLRFDEQHDDLGMRRVNARFNGFDRLFYLRRRHLVGKLDTQRRNDLARRKMNGQCTVSMGYSGLLLSDTKDRLGKRRMRTFADQQVLAFSRQQGGGCAQQRTDRDRSHAIK